MRMYAIILKQQQTNAGITRLCEALQQRLTGLLKRLQSPPFEG